jgi:tetratricopeptide (TPR) repeat protein
MRNTTCLNSRSRMSRRFVSVNALSILLLLTFNHSSLLFASTHPLPEAQSKSAKFDEAQRIADESTRLRQQGRYDEAIPVVERWLAIVEKVSGASGPNVAVALNNFAGLYQDKGDYAKAEPLFQRALAIMEKARGPKHPDVATNYWASFIQSGEWANLDAKR